MLQRPGERRYTCLACEHNETEKSAIEARKTGAAPNWWAAARCDRVERGTCPRFTLSGASSAATTIDHPHT